jgi:cytochrome P450
LVSIDEPEHAKLRQITQSWFSPKNLVSLKTRVDDIADKAIADMVAGDGHIDFVKDVALYYPLRIIMEILGVPDKDLAKMLRLTQEIFAPADPDSQPEGIDLNDPAFFAKALNDTMGQVSEYFWGLAEERRLDPRDDVASVLASAKIDGKLLSKADLAGYFAIIATAGHDTTSSSTSAVMYALATQSELLARVKADISLVPKLVEEAIRWGSPVKTFMRSVSEDMEFQGRSFKAGDWIMLCYAGANHDPAVFKNGASFDLDRENSRHLAFGKGIHMCLGQHLARLEIKTFFERLIPKIKQVRLAGDPAMSSSYFVNGLKHLPIQLEFE